MAVVPLTAPRLDIRTMRSPQDLIRFLDGKTKTEKAKLLMETNFPQPEPIPGRPGFYRLLSPTDWVTVTICELREDGSTVCHSGCPAHGDHWHTPWVNDAATFGPMPFLHLSIDEVIAHRKAQLRKTAYRSDDMPVQSLRLGKRNLFHPEGIGR
jgi:hypothetical protein